MEQKSIHLNDWDRILLGSMPWQFLLEIILRGVFTYIILMLSVRLLGKRIGAHLSLFELSMIVVIAAAAGIPLEVPVRGLLPPVVILVVIIAFHRIVSLAGMKAPRVERLATGTVSLIVQDGRLLLDEMRRSALSPERVFSCLRSKGLQHLGQVHLLYMEASGDFTLLTKTNPEPGLSLIPNSDVDLLVKSLAPGAYVCSLCGDRCDQNVLSTPCRYCGSVVWREASLELNDE